MAKKKRIKDNSYIGLMEGLEAKHKIEINDLKNQHKAEMKEFEKQTLKEARKERVRSNSDMITVLLLCSLLAVSVIGNIVQGYYTVELKAEQRQENQSQVIEIK